MAGRGGAVGEGGAGLDWEGRVILPCRARHPCAPRPSPLVSLVLLTPLTALKSLMAVA